MSTIKRAAPAANTIVSKLCPLCKIAAITLLLFISGFAFAQISVITLQRSDASQLLPVIASQLSSTSSVNVYQNQIILNATPEETARIKALIKQLDSHGRQLLISVKTDSNAQQQQNQTNVRVEQQGNTRITTTTRTIGSSANDSGQQSIRATEGLPSLISIGQSRIINPHGEGQQWHNANTGFYATARVSGNLVNLSIEQEKSAFTNNGQRDQQQLTTQLSGRLGEWILIGSVADDSRNRQYSNGSLENRKLQSGTLFYLKVDLLQ